MANQVNDNRNGYNTNELLGFINVAHAKGEVASTEQEDNLIDALISGEYVIDIATSKDTGKLVIFINKA